ncbi:MAG: carbohydrate-binding module family 20 domain-containing protein [Terracidiphilus sp.]|nr:carbohydrate-binding module family 20 domain-containing protein [Terracidiphilus sp.]
MNVSFAVTAPTAFGDVVVVVGSPPQLGAWSIETSCRLAWRDGVWAGAVESVWTSRLMVRVDSRVCLCCRAGLVPVLLLHYLVLSTIGAGHRWVDPLAVPVWHL